MGFIVLFSGFYSAFVYC